MMLRPGTMIKGKYRIDRKIYKGGMGIVYVCTDIHGGDQCVIKHPVLNGADDDLRAEKLRVEASILKTLSHPYIVRYINSFEENGVFYMVIEYINGKDMTALYANRPIAEPQMKEYCRKLLEALEYLHNLNIIHRDIKPANIMVTGTGIKLIDFGGAKMRFTSMGKRGTVLYTPGYGAPEQQAGEFYFQSDIFAVGATMYFLLTGKNPCRRPPLSPCSENPTVGKKIDSIIKKATNFDPNQRYQTISEMRNALLGISVPRPIYNPRLIIGSKEYKITKTPFTIGRGGVGITPDVTINDPERYISRMHARILTDASGNYYIENLSSSNNSYIYFNGSYKEIKSRWYLMDNDVIAFCWSPTKGPYLILKFKI
ncbi:MAG: FHA domain-containing serine/threonine-protein kinase [Candidatus Methanofastidiosia archaeon]